MLSGSGANRTIRLAPAANRFGTTTISVTVSDGLQSTTSTFVLTVNSVNDAPTINSVGSQTTLEDTPLSPLTFMIGDIESPVTQLTVTATSSSSVLFPASNLVLGGNGAQRTLTITPAANLSGAANITVTVSDGQATASTVFSVTVIPVNDPPTLSHIGPLTIDEDTATHAISFSIVDLETSVGSLVVTATSPNQQLVPDGNLLLRENSSIRTITATPAANQFGVTTITVTVSDGILMTLDSFDLTVNSVNDRPTASVIANQTILEDAATTAIPFSIGDVETSAADLVVTATSSNGTLVPSGNIVLGGSGANRTITVTPAANQNGTATITVQISDGLLSATDTFILTVTAVDDPPTLVHILDQSTNEDVPLIVPLSLVDIDTSIGILKVTATSSNTTLVPAANLVVLASGDNRSLKITPTPNLSGTATITVKVSDGTSTISDTFLLTVAAVNDPPTISHFTNKTTNENTATAAIPFTIGDIDSPSAGLTVTATSSNATLVPNAGLLFTGTGTSRTLKAIPAANMFGATTITVAVNDGTSTTTSTFLLTVNPVNRPPTISDVPNQTTRHNTPTSAIPFTIGDRETDAAKLTVSATSSNTTLVPNANIVFGGSGANRTLRITPALNRTGTSTITLRVRDGSLTSTDTFVLTVTASSSALSIASLVTQESTVPTLTNVRNASTSSSKTSSTVIGSAHVSSSATASPDNRIARVSSDNIPKLAQPIVQSSRSIARADQLDSLDAAFRANDWIVWL